MMWYGDDMNSKGITIKEQDLHAIVQDLMDKALAINRLNKEKICQFVVNLVENGGHKTKAALDAGYGAKKDKDGKVRNDKERNHIACSEATQLLSNADISSVYETLLAHRFMSKIFVKNLTKEHLTSILYQAGLKGLNSERNFKSGISAIVEAAKLAGFYNEDSKKDSDDLDDKKEELIKAAAIFATLADKTGNTLVDKKRLN